MAGKIKNVTFLVDMMKYKTSSASREVVDPISIPVEEARDPSETTMSFFDHHEYTRDNERRDPPGELNTYDSYDDQKGVGYCSSRGYFSYARSFASVPAGNCHSQRVCTMPMYYPVYSESSSVYSHGPHPTLSDATQVDHEGPAAVAVGPSQVAGRSRPSKSRSTYYNCQQTFYENFKQHHQKLLDRLNCALPEEIEEDAEESSALSTKFNRWIQSKSSFFCQMQNIERQHLREAIGDITREKSELEQELRMQLEEIKIQRKIMEEQFLNEIKKECSENAVLEAQLQTKLLDRMEKRVMMEMVQSSEEEYLDVVEENRIATRTPRVVVKTLDSKPLRLLSDEESSVTSSSIGSPMKKVVMFKNKSKLKSALRGELSSPKAYRLLMVTMSQPGTLGLEIEVGDGVTSSARVARVIPDSQGDKAGIKGGDVLCHADSDVEFSYHEFLRLAQSGSRPLRFNVRRAESAFSKECPRAVCEEHSQVSEHNEVDQPKTVFSSASEIEASNQDQQVESLGGDIEALNQDQPSQESNLTEESVSCLTEVQIKSLARKMPEVVTDKDLSVLVNNIEKYISENAAKVLAKVEAEVDAKDVVEDVDDEKKTMAVQEDNSKHKTSTISSHPPPLFDEKELSNLVNCLEQPKQQCKEGSEDKDKIDTKDKPFVQVPIEEEPRPLESSLCSTNQVHPQRLDRDADDTVSEAESIENAEKKRQEEVKAALETLDSLGYTRSQAIIAAKANLAKAETAKHLKPSLVLLPGNTAQDSDITSPVAEQKGRKIRVEVVKTTGRREVSGTALGLKTDLAAKQETKSRARSKSKRSQKSSSGQPQKQKTTRADNIVSDNGVRTSIPCSLKGEDKENSPTRKKPSLAIKTQNLSMVSPSSHQSISALSVSSKIPFSPTHCYSPNALSSNSQSSQISALGSLPFSLHSTNKGKRTETSRLVTPVTGRGIIDVE